MRLLYGGCHWAASKPLLILQPTAYGLLWSPTFTKQKEYQYCSYAERQPDQPRPFLMLHDCP